MFVGNNENVLTAIITFFALYNFSQFNGEDRLKDDTLSEIMNQERAGYRRTCQKNFTGWGKDKGQFRKIK